MPFTWNNVAPGQVVDDVQNNLLGQAVQGHDASIGSINASIASINASVALMPYRDRIITSGTVGSVTFSNIPTNLRRVKVAYSARGDTAANAIDFDLQINGDTTNGNYGHGLLFTVNAAAPGAGFNTSTDRAQCGNAAAANGPAGRFGAGWFEIPGWDQPHTGLNGYGFGGGLTNNTAGTMVCMEFFYTGAGPYSSIKLIPRVGNWISGSDFQLEGYR